MDYIDAFNLDVDEESKEDETPFEPVFQLEAWKELMPHVGFTNWKQFAKCPLSKKLELALEKNVGRHAHLIINDTVYKCNVLVLRVFCELFANCLKINQVVQFPKDTLTNESFEVAYAWMTGIDEALCPNDGQQLLDVLKAAEILRCPLLCKSVFEALNDYNNFFELTAFDCFVAAISRGFFQVAHMMLRRVGKCFLVVVGSYQFQEMHANFLCNLLGSNTLAVQSEIEIYYSALLWLSTDFRKKMKHTARILEKVRFHMMPPAFLLHCADTLEDMEPELADMVCAYLDRAIQTQHETHMGFSGSEKNTMDTRVWIRDPKCPYDWIVDKNGACILTVDRFLTYLDAIQESRKTFMYRMRKVVPIIDENTITSKRHKDLIYQPSRNIFDYICPEYIQTPRSAKSVNYEIYDISNDPESESKLTWSSSEDSEKEDTEKNSETNFIEEDSSDFYEDSLSGSSSESFMNSSTDSSSDSSTNSDTDSEMVSDQSEEAEDSTTKLVEVPESSTESCTESTENDTGESSEDPPTDTTVYAKSESSSGSVTETDFF